VGWGKIRGLPRGASCPPAFSLLAGALAASAFESAAGAGPGLDAASAARETVGAFSRFYEAGSDAAAGGWRVTQFPDFDTVLELIGRLGWLAMEVPCGSGFDPAGAPWYQPRAAGQFMFRAVQCVSTAARLAARAKGGPIPGEQPPVEAVAPTREEALHKVYREICARTGRVPEV
jgi:hypothetical protein